MALYAALLYYPPGRYWLDSGEHLTASDYAEFFEAATAAGVRRDGEAFHPAEQAATFPVAGGKGGPVTTAPGPAAEGPDVLGGFPMAALAGPRLTACPALAELAAEGMLIAAGTASLPGTPALTLTYNLPGYSAGVRIEVNQPGVLSDVVRLPHRLRRQGLWASRPTSSSPIWPRWVLTRGPNAGSWPGSRAMRGPGWTRYRSSPGLAGPPGVP